MPSTTKYPVLRQTLIVVSFLALVGLFFTLNHFVIIPRQQQTYNQKIFRVLKEVAEDFQSSVDGQADFLARNNKRNGDTTIISPACNSLKPALLASFHKLKATIDTNIYRREYFLTTDSIRLKLVNNRTDPVDTAARRKLINNRKDSIDTTLTIASVLKPTIELLHKDLFDLVMLVKRDTARDEKKFRLIQDQILYEFGELAASYILPGDTLFKDPRYGQFSSISDITIAGTDYKAFTQPFRFNEQQLMLVGFLKENSYKFTTTSYSKPTLLWIIFLLTVFILSLPLIKIYLSSRQERISTNDLRMLMVVFIAMPFLVILTALTLLIYRQRDIQTNEDLGNLHAKVQQNFKKEIQLVLKQLRQYDSLPAFEAKLCSTYNDNLRLHDTLIPTDFRDILFYPKIYKNVDDIFWVSHEGKQIAKWFFLKDPVIYLDVSSRDYFKKIKAGQMLFSGNQSYYIEPTISWATGKYGINILTASNQDFSTGERNENSSKAIMIGLAANMYSVCNPVVPKGYNFCIIDQKGEILFHSQTERSLHQNLFEESNANYDLQNAVQEKDSTLIGDLQLFDRDAKAMVSPIDGMPSFYLISYLNKRELNLFVYHVSAFTLLCCALSLFALLVLLLLYYLFGSKAKATRFYSYESAWMKPSKNKNSFYQDNLLQQILVVSLGLLFLFILIVFNENQHWFLLQCSILLPFFVVTGYFLLRNEQKKSKLSQVGIERRWKDLLTFCKSKRIGSVSAIFRNKADFITFWQKNSRLIIIYAFSIFFILLSLNFFQERKFRFVPFILMMALSAATPLIAWLLSLFSRKADEFLKKAGTKNVADTTTAAERRSIKEKSTTPPYLANYTRLISFSSFFISVLPAIGIGSFAINEERQMHIRTNQFDVAKKIDTRRDFLNNYFNTTKLIDTIETDYKRTRKLSESGGIYLLHNRLDTISFPKRPVDKDVVHSQFYQSVTKFLFLPKDHTDFLDDNPLYYYWYWDRSEPKQDIAFAYRNETDYTNTESIAFRHSKGNNNLLLSMFTSYGGALILLGLLAFFTFLPMLIQVITKKIFLLGYFDYKEDSATSYWVNQYYTSPHLYLNAKDKEFFDIKDGGVLTDDMIGQKEMECMENPREEEERILHIEYLLTPAYSAIWQKLEPDEKFVLFDFALDGFTNFKNIDLLYRLYQKGLIRKRHNQQLELMSQSFRSYLIGKSGTEEILLLERDHNSGSTWKNLKNIFYILFFAILIFLLATQQDVSNRILAIVSGLATLVPLLLKIFDKNIMGGSAGSDSKTAAKPAK